LLILVLLVPAPESSESAALSSYSASSVGARGLYDVLDRLGFPVERRLAPMRDSLPVETLYAVLAPPQSLTLTEVNRLLAAVRSGAGLLFVTPEPSRLADSLGVRSALEIPVATQGRESAASLDSAMRLGPGWARSVLRSPDGDSLYRLPPGSQVFLSIPTKRGREPVIVGLRLGQGRVVIVADPDLLRNSVLRRGDAGVRAVRLIEWIQNGASRPIVFDEYHQGFGTHADPLRVARRALTETGPGRAILVLGVAGLVLLVAVGVRPIRPSPLERIERRSPLEHVDALARAYAATRGTSRAARLLVRGLRRRHGGIRSGLDDAQFLRSITQQEADAKEDADRLVSAMEGATSPEDGQGIAAAILRLEQRITS
jgi:hypothetical protein